MQLNFKYTYQTEAGEEIKLDVRATYHRGFIGKYPEPDEEPEMQINDVLQDGKTTDINFTDEDWVNMELAAWEQLEIENDRRNDVAKRHENVESRIYTALYLR